MEHGGSDAPAEQGADYEVGQSPQSGDDTDASEVVGTGAVLPDDSMMAWWKLRIHKRRSGRSRGRRRRGAKDRESGR